MTRNYRKFDGYRDSVTDEMTFLELDKPPASVIVTPKEVGSVFVLPENWTASEILEAVDFGVPEGFFQRSSVPGSFVCGDRVILYFNNAGWNRNYDDPRLIGGLISSAEWSSLLSQIKTLHSSFPWTVGLDNQAELYPEFIIDSPDFTAPEGIWNHSIDGVTGFPGRFVAKDTKIRSTFKVGPRIFGDDYMAALDIWPPSGEFARTWNPFRGLDLRRIENQGKLSEKCEQIYASNLVYTDEEGYERVDAYPSGGKPRIIKDAIGPLTSFQLDSGSRFPVWDCAELVQCIRPVVAKEVVLPTKSGSVSIPVGPDLREATKLDTFINGIEDIVRGKDEDGKTQEVPLVFGLKLLGIAPPPTVRHYKDAHWLYRHQASGIAEGAQVGIQARPRWVSAFFNFSLGSALNQFYGNENEDLLWSEVANASVLNDYASIKRDPNYAYGSFSRPYYWVDIKPDGTISGLTIPKITSPHRMYIDGSYLGLTFSHGRTGHLSFQIPGGPAYEGEIRYRLPALPELNRSTPSDPGHVVVRPYFYTCAHTSGEAYSYDNNYSAGSMQLAWGRMAKRSMDAKPFVVLNMTYDWFMGDSEEAQAFKDELSDETWAEIWKVVSGASRPQMQFSIAISRNGFEIEPFDTRSIEYTFDFQDGLFDQAEIDPTTIPNILLPLDRTWTKVSGAYRRALNIRTPLNPKTVYMDQRILNEPQKEILGGVGGYYVPSYTFISSYGAHPDIADSYVYKLEDIDIPDFTLGDAEGTAFETWDGVFSYLIYGDLDSFKASHGVPDATAIGGSKTKPKVASSDSLPLGVLNWTLIDLISAPGYSQAFIPAALTPSGAGMRGFGVGLFREEIPIYEDMPPLFGDPIFIQFSRVGDDYTWDGSWLYSFRQAVEPATVPI